MTTIVLLFARWQRDGRRPFRLVAIALVIVGFVCLVARPAHAQFFTGFDPAGQVQSFATANNWLGQAQNWARTIYLSLVVFEVFALGVTTLLFRDNLGEFFAGVTMKIVLGSLFFWFISVAGPSVSNLPGAVLATFGTTFGQGMGGTNDVSSLATKGLAATGLLFGASYAMRLEDGLLASEAEAIPPNCTVTLAAGFGGGVCYRQPGETFEYVRQVAELVLSGLAVMVGMAIAAVYLQFTLITIESYLVMTAGTLFIGFAGSRFTMPFSQGYFSYMVSVGVKLMALYLALGIVGPLMETILESSIGAAISALADPTGVAALASAAFGSLSVVVGAGIIAMVPGFAASFISGQSFASGAAALSQAVSSFASSAQMMAQLGASSMARQQAAQDRENVRNVEQSMAKYGAPGTMAPLAVAGVDSFAQGPSSGGLNANSTSLGGQTVLGDTLGINRAPSGAAPDRTFANVSPSDGPVVPRQAAPLGQSNHPGDQPSASVNDASFTTSRDSDIEPTQSGTVLSPTGQPMGVQVGSSNGGASLYGASVSELNKMSESDILSRLSNTRWSDLKDKTQQWLIENGYGEKALDKFRDNSNRDDIQAELAEGYALSGLSQAVIRDVGPPTAVQVRITAPDKL